MASSLADISALTLAEIQQLTENWTADAKAKVIEAYRRRIDSNTQVWYCQRGPTCDGKPHDNIAYSHARDDQWPPTGNDWFLWLILSGRGSGKTRTGSEWMRTISSKVARSAMIGRRGVDVRATMVEGESGLIKVCELAGIDYDWQPSKREFTFSNGHKVFGYSAEEPDSLRGPQHGAAWLDEPAHMPEIEEVWSNLLFGLRLPGLPGGAKALCTSTPLPVAWVKEQEKAENARIVRVSTYKNIANLDEAYQQNVIKKYEGTRLGRQELHGETLGDVEGALWNPTLFTYVDRLPEFDRIVVSVDPAGETTKRADQTGIVVMGKKDDDLYLLEDATPDEDGKMSPNEWANKAIDLFLEWDADCIVAEKNFGGSMVSTTILNAAKARGISVRVKVTHAAQSKKVRAEPLVGLYEQKRVFHARGVEKVEVEMCEWVPGVGDSPNRVDATVWAHYELMGKAKSSPVSIARPTGKLRAHATRTTKRRIR